MDDLVRWLKAQLDEEERIARAATDGPWSVDSECYAESIQAANGTQVIAGGRWGGEASVFESIEDAVFIAAWSPDRVLRGIATKRAVLSLHTQSIRDGGCQVCDVPGGRRLRPDACTSVRLLAVEYETRPGYRDEWRP